MAERASRSQTVRYAAEAAAMALFSGFGRLVPAAAAPWIGATLGRLAGRLDGKRRRVAIDNLRRAFGEEMSEERARGIALDYYAHLGRGVMETQVILRHHPRKAFHEWFDFDPDQLEEVRRLKREHGALVFVTCHGGPWELMGAAVSELIATAHAVFRPMPNPWLNRRLRALREKLGLPLIQYDQRALARMQKLLKKGECVALLADLNQRRGGVFADFFGRPASTTRAPGILAARLGVPVVCGYGFRAEGRYRYGAYFDPVIFAPDEGSVDDRVLSVTQRINQSIEGFARRHPTQWQWNYKRWKTQPETVS